MLICMDTDFVFLLFENLCERGGGRRLMQREVLRQPTGVQKVDSYTYILYKV